MKIHRHFPETNPDYECANRSQNRGQHLEIQKKNQAAYPTVDMLLKNFDPLFDHPLRENDEPKADLDQDLLSLKNLEFSIVASVLATKPVNI